MSPIRTEKKHHLPRLSSGLFIQIDHVNNDGPLDRWYGKIPYIAYLKKVAEDATGRYQILCHNCNWIKRRETAQEMNEELRRIAYVKV